MCHICIHYTVIRCSSARSFDSTTNTKQHEKPRYITHGLGKMCQSISDKFLPWHVSHMHTLYRRPVLTRAVIRLYCMTNTKQHKNPRYLTRGLGKMCQSISVKFLPWPTCKIHYDLVTSNFDLYSWVWSSMGDAHGPVHNWLGGEIDCAATYIEIGNLVGADVAEVLAYLGSGYRQGLFCDGIWRCTKIASVDEKPSEVRT